MEDSLLKLKNTSTKAAFKYGYLLKKMYPYIKTVMFRTLLLFLLAIPLGLLDGVVAFSLRPYLDYVVNGNETQIFEFQGHTIKLQAFLIQFMFCSILQGQVAQLMHQVANNSCSCGDSCSCNHEEKNK